VKLSSEQIECLKGASRTFGYREIDSLMPVFKELKSSGFVYETVRAFYTTEAGRRALAEQKDRTNG